MMDIAVIGGGPAGLTAALYAARAGRSVAVFEGSGFGGQITLSPLVENYPGLGAVSGMELGDRMYAQAEAAGAELTFSGVQRIERNTDGTFLLETEDGPVSARAVICAAGAKPRTLGLPAPGGPSVANAAKTGDPKAYRLPVPHVEGRYNVSFSGLKTAVLNEVNQAQMKGTDINVPDLAASFQERIAGILAEKLLLAAADTGAKQVCLAGGVAANGRLRQLVNDGAQKLGARVYLPELKFCGDNGAMIAAQGYYQYIAGHTAGLELNGLPTLPIDYE